MTVIGIQPFAKIPDRSHSAKFRLREMAAKLAAPMRASLGVAARAGEDRSLGVPNVSVVICAYNEERNIGQLLLSILNEEINEIIVIASGCTDRTVDIVKRFETRDPRVRLLVENKRNGKTSAVNLALDAATGDYLVFLAADVRPSQGSILKLIEGFRPEIGIRVGRPIPIDEKSSVMGRLSHLIWTLHNRTLHELSNAGKLGHATGEFFAIRKGLITQLPPHVVNDDAYMAITVRKAGYKIGYEDEAIAFMHGPGTVSDYLTQRRRVHFGHIQVMKSTGSYPTVFESQALGSPAFFLHMLGEEIKGLGGGLRAFLLGGALEVIALTLSNLDRIVGRTHVLWNIVESTKTLTGTMGGVSGGEAAPFSTLGAYPVQSLDRNFRFGLTRDRLSQRFEASAPRLNMCY